MSTISVAIKATPEQVWHALTDPDTTPAYYYGFRGEFDLHAGAPYRYTAGGGDMITGSVLSVDAPKALTTTFAGHWDPAIAALPESTVRITLADPPMPAPGVTVLTLVHDGLPDGEAAEHLAAGWVMILSGMKTLLETGAPLAG